jgi:hypothetical protein
MDVYDTETDDNTRYIAEQIFSKPVGKPKSIQLQLEEQTADLGFKDPSGFQSFVYKIVGMITYHGVKILFGHSNLHQLSENDYYLIRAYVNSFGYDIIKEIRDEQLLVGFTTLK